MQKKKEKKYRGDARQTMKGRAGSTRNGFCRTVGSFRSPEITEEEMSYRNDLLNVQENICFWCKNSEATDLDHILPACNTRNDIYSYTNMLCLFPSCKNCNSRLKGGKLWEQWKIVLEEKFNDVWSEENIEMLDCWIQMNLHKLILDENCIEYINEQHQHINDFHKVGEYCAQNGLDIKTELLKYWGCI